MKKAPDPAIDEQINLDPDMRQEYDFRAGVRGKYVHRFAGDIRRNMLPEHALETWDEEVTTYGELLSRPKTQTETEPS